MSIDIFDCLNEESQLPAGGTISLSLNEMRI